MPLMSNNVFCYYIGTCSFILAFLCYINHAFATNIGCVGFALTAIGLLCVGHWFAKKGN